MEILQDAWSLYKRRFSTMMLLSFTLVFPMLLVHFFATNFFYQFYQRLYAPYFADLTHFIFLMMVLCLAVIPFIRLIEQDVDGEIDLTEVYRTFFRYLFPVYVMGFVYALMVTAGTILFLVPGLLLLIWFSMFPYVAVVEGETWFQGFKRAFEVGRRHFFPLLGLIVLLGLGEKLIEYIGLLLSVQLTANYLFIALVQMLINLFFLPFYTSVMAHYYIDRIE